MAVESTYWTKVTLFLAGLLLVVAGGLFAWQRFFPTFISEKQVKTPIPARLDFADSTEWLPLPYFEKDFAVLAYYPFGWTSPSLGSIPDPQYPEGGFMWGMDAADKYGVSDMYYSLVKYLDTGDDLDTWVAKKAQEIERIYGVTPVIQKVTRGKNEMRKVCVSGTPNGFASSGCFVYWHQSPYIIELEVDSSVVALTELDRFAEAFASRFTLLGPEDDWETYASFNSGYSIRYDPDALPLSADTGVPFYTAFGSGDPSFGSAYAVGISVSSGVTDDVEKIWFNQERNMTHPVFPTSLYVDGQECLFTNRETKSDDLIPEISLLCKRGTKLYSVSAQVGSDDELSLLLSMLSTMKFHDDNMTSDGRYIFREAEAGFELEYLDDYSVYSESYPIGPNYSFSKVSSSSLYDWTSNFNISFQKTDLSITECLKTDSCILYTGFQNIEDFTDGRLLGIPTKERRTEGNSVQSTLDNRQIIFQRDGRIFLISLLSKDEDASEIAEILRSFRFVE